MRTKQKAGAQFMQQLSKKKQVDCAISSNSENSEDEVDDIPVYKKDIKKQRCSVSAEAYGMFNKKENFKAKIIPKSNDQKQRIKERLSESFMFMHLDDKDREIIIGAMEEKKFNKDEWVIRQGDEGNELYVVDYGELECYKKYGDGVEKFLKIYVQGESFGELALLFQSPRAASIKVKSQTCTLWSLDRETFNIIVKEASIKKREHYEQFLQEWDLLKEIDDPYEKLKMSDVLFDKNYGQGEMIKEAGNQMDAFYIILEGRIGIFKNDKKVLELNKKGEYFGDISIVQNKPEPFTYVSIEESKLFYIPKKSYSSTLKIIQDTLLAKIQQKYGKIL